jgi:di/tricarboxylate transporter
VTPAALSLAALLFAIALSIVSRINVGLVAIGLAWIVGVYAAGLTADTVVRGFPSSLFLTLAGVTLLFAAAETNGTLAGLAERALRLARGNARVLPIFFFLIASLVASIGPGAISSVALVAPFAMAVGARAGVPFFLTALMVANGANSGNLSPVSAVGVIVNNAMTEAGLGGHEIRVWLANLSAHMLVATVAYFLLGGHRLKGRAARDSLETGDGSSSVPTAAGGALPPTFTPAQRVTLAIIAAWVVGVVFFKLNVGLSAFAAVVVLVAAHAIDESTSIKRMPWGVIVMVCGVSVLIGVLEATGGMDLFTALLAGSSTPGTVNGVMAFFTGAISTYSSTSGVVLPTFLPTVPGVIEKLGGGDPLALSLSINVGASLVDVSPLSTLGALCVANVPDGAEAKKLFRQLLIWGLSMAVIGALLCQLLAGPFANA